MTEMPAEMLRATEASFVAEAPLREVNRTVDEHILPAEFYSAGRTRLFSPGACVMIAFYHASAHDLTKLKRVHVIGKVEARLRHLAVPAIRARLSEDWRLKDGFVTVDFAPFIERALDRFEQLREASAMVTASPDVMAGVPVIRSTRVPVHDVAASVRAGYPIERLRAAYPSLDDRQIRLAALYAQANPVKGRPRASSPLPGLLPGLPTGTLEVSEQRVRRREAAA